MIGSELLYLKKFWNFHKFVNAAKNILSFYFSKWSGGYFVWGKPYTFFIEPTNLCNLRCTECPVGLKQLKRPQGYMPLADYQKIVTQISEHAWYLLLYFQGESAMHPELIKMIKYAAERKIFVELSTNGTRLANIDFATQIMNSQLGNLIISLDGATEETYTIYRQAGLFSRVIEGVRNVVRLKKSGNKSFPKIILQFLVMRHNEHEIELMKKLSAELSVDKLIFKSPQIYDFDSAEDILPTIEKFRRYEQKNGGYQLKGSYSGYCRKLWIGSVITQDGAVIPCCFDKDANYKLGDLNSCNFSESWHSNEYHSFRKRVMKRRESIDMCKNCSEGLKTFY